MNVAVRKGANRLDACLAGAQFFDKGFEFKSFLHLPL